MYAVNKIQKTLKTHPKGLTVEEVAEICGITRNTAYVKLRDMFHFQMVLKVESEAKTLYRLVEHDISVDYEKHGRSKEDFR